MGFVVKAVKKVVKAVVGVVSKVVGGVVGFLIGGKKSAKKATSANTLNKTLEPEAYRKIVFGRTAAPLDVRFWEVWGAKGTNYDEVLALACHRINGVKELYFENDLAINNTGVVQTKFAGIVSRLVNLGAPGQTALSVGSGTQWTTASTFDGCAHMALKWVPNETKLPNGIPNRYTQVVEGAFVYDPRRDSTQPGGSGPHRANDQSTWSYATLDGNSQPIGRNNALQALWYLLGWRVQNPVTGEWNLVAGRGVDPQDINMSTFITGANNCEVAAYYTDVVLSTEDDHIANEDKITCDGLIARLIDPGGLWSYYANVDDTANIAVELTDSDIIEGVNVSWNEYKGMNDQFNQVRGKFVYPAHPVLFQAYAYPMVRDSVYEANLGVKRAKPLDFEQVLDSVLAQRLARLFLNQGQYQGEFSAGFNYRMLNAQAYSVVRYTSERYGWTKLFRVWRHDITIDAGIGALLKEIHPSIWGAGTVTYPTAPGLSNPYNPAMQISATGVNVALYPVVGANGDKGDGFRIYWDLPPTNVRRTEVRYRLVGSSYWETAGPVASDIFQIVVAPLLSGAIYEAAIRHISIHEVPGPWVNPSTFPANASGQFQLGTTGNVNYAAIAAAGGTANWSSITGAGKPADNADVTGANIAAGFVNQGALSTKDKVNLTTDVLGKLDIQNVVDGLINTKITLTNSGGNVTLSGAGGGSFNLGSLGAKALAVLDSVQFGTSSILESPGVQATLANFKTSSGISAGFVNQGPWSTYSKSIGSITAPSNNLFPYPRPVADGTTMINMGWRHPDTLEPVNATHLGGWVYVYKRTNGGAVRAYYPHYRIDISEYSPNYAVSLNGYVGGSGTFNPYCEWLDIDGNYISTFFMSLNTTTGRYEGVGARPTNARKFQIVCNANFPASSSYQDLVFWGIKIEANNVVTPYTDNSNQIISGNLIVDGTIVSRMIKTDAIGAREIAASAIGASEIAANAIVSGHIGAGVIIAMHIGAGQITADKITVNNLAALSTNLGAVTAGSLNINGLFIVNSNGQVTIKSATSGARSEQDAAGYRIYNASGVAQIELIV